MIRVLLLSTVLFPAALGAQSHARIPEVQAALVPQTRSIRPGTPLRMAIHLSVAPGWHIYWKNPGESGLPTTVRWRGSAGFRTGPIWWPYPERKESFGLVTHTYEGEIVLLTELHPPEDLRAGEQAKLLARVGWGVCREVCIPQEVRLSVRLPVSERTPRPNPRWRSIVAIAEPRLPRSLPEWTVRAHRAELGIILRITPPEGEELPSEPLLFFPEDPSLLSAAVPMIRQPESDGLVLRIDAVTDDTAPPAHHLRGVLVAPPGSAFAEGVRALRVEVPISSSAGGNGHRRTAVSSRNRSRTCPAFPASSSAAQISAIVCSSTSPGGDPSSEVDNPSAARKRSAASTASAV